MGIKIGITGGIGSGKSVVAHLLAVLGVPVYVSDEETRGLMVRDAAIRKGLVNLLGEAVYQQNALNKPLLASYLFASEEHARQVNAIVHPRVKEDFHRWVRQHQPLHALVGIESAILLEAGFAAEVDYVVMVYAPLEIRIARAMKRDAADRAAVERRIQCQMDDEKKRALADFVIVNDGKQPLLPQVLDLVRKLSF